MENNLPKGWLEVELEQCCDILDSIRVPVNSDERAKRQGDIPYYGATGQVGLIDDFLFNEELVLIGEDGAPFYDKSKNIAYIVNGKSWVNNHAHVLRAKEVTTNKFINYFLNDFDYNGYVNGTTRLKLTQGKLKEIPVLLPPLPEQQRIVEKLDALMARISNSKTRLEKIPTLLKNFRQSVLVAAVSGELTKEWREENEMPSIEEVIQQIKNRRIENAKSESKKKEIKEIYDSIEVGNHFDLPDEWRFISLDKVCSGFQYGSSQKSDNKGLIPVLRMGNLQNGKIDWTDLKYSSDKDEIQKYLLEKNDILFNRTNSPELVGKTSIYKGEQKAIFAGYLIRVNYLSEVSPDYLNYCLNTPYAKEWCQFAKTDGVSQSNINAQKLAKFEIPFCSLEEQREIVRKVDELFHFADSIEARYQKAKAWFDKLPQAILAKAFRGELVPQNEADEPASVLLERIKNSKTKSEKSKPSPKAKQRKMYEGDDQLSLVAEE